ncbi:MAG: flagellar hook capping FlgD N-terminal domain-containing protein [Pseudomonadota bacterium]
MTDAISQTGATPIVEPREQDASSLSRLAGDFNSFLQLLTAQVSNQDPLAPMDSSTFVTQLAQLSQVEQTVSVNTNLEVISSQIAAANNLTDVDLIGRDVTIVGDSFGNTSTSGTLGYELAVEAASVSARITTEEGALVRTFNNLPTLPGTRQEITWDGLDETGTPVADETLVFELEAYDADGAPVPFIGYVNAKVESVLLEGDASELLLSNGEKVPSSSVLAVN